MRKTSVYLNDDEAEGLRRVAAREGRAQADLIREGVRHVIAETESRPRSFHSLGAGRGGLPRPAHWSSEELYRKTMGQG